jgi:hypothetical protein
MGRKAAVGAGGSQKSGIQYSVFGVRYSVFGRNGEATVEIAPYLEDLERRIDPAVEERLLGDWRRFTEEGVREPFFVPKRARPSAPGLAWPEVGVNEALDDYDRMALQQLRGCSAQLESGGGGLLAVRCNYGSSILPSLFGVRMFVMDPALNTLPTSEPFPRGADDVRAWLDRGVPDLDAGYGRRTWEMGRRFVAMLRDYPKLRRWVFVYHPDLQGPVDVCEVLWGSAFFLELLDAPDLVKAFLALITDAYVRFMRRWETLVPPPDGWATHWSMLHKGRIMLRNDSATNLSPAMYEEFVRPFDQRLLSEFGGGAMHYCGRGHHVIGKMTEMAGLYAVNISQPHLNDMEALFRHTVDKGIPLIGLKREAAEQAVAAGRPLRGRVQCW